jgi:Domain of unknown function (DUF4352)
MRWPLQARFRFRPGTRRTSFGRALRALCVTLVVGGCGGQIHSDHGFGGLSAPMFSAAAFQMSAIPPPWLQPEPLQPTAPTQLDGAAVGAVQSVTTRAAALQVSVNAVLDPLRASGAQLPNGTRAVAVYVQIRNHGPATYNSSATGDFTLAVSHGPVTPLLVPHGACKTPLNDFDRAITSGEDRVGCIAFSVARDARVEAVEFSPHAEPAGRLSWRP